MRKILVGIVSVAGLLAVALALSTSPATAATKVVTVTTKSITPAGEYTVTWESKGGCDPGSGTSGASGSVVLTVEATNEVLDPEAPNVLELTGLLVEDAVTINDDCSYTWNVTFIDAATESICQDARGPTTFAPTGTPLTLQLVPDKNKCAAIVKIVVNIIPTYGGWIDGRYVAPVEEVRDSADKVTVEEVKESLKKENTANEGAILAHTFTASATPHKDAPKEGCTSTDTKDSEVDRNETVTKLDDTVAVTLKVVNKNAANKACTYDVSISVPIGFSLDTPESGILEEIPVAGVVKDNKFHTYSYVSIASRPVYLVQTVDGDAGGAAATYKVRATCSSAELPPDLLGVKSVITGVSGIYQIGGDVVAELREGTFNITAALGTDKDGNPIINTKLFKYGVPIAALDEEGVACTAYIKKPVVLPDGCQADFSNSRKILTDYVKIDDKVRIDIAVDCTPPAPPVDTGGDMTGDGDMGDGGDLMSPDPGDVPPADDPAPDGPPPIGDPG